MKRSPEEKREWRVWRIQRLQAVYGMVPSDADLTKVYRLACPHCGADYKFNQLHYIQQHFFDKHGWNYARISEREDEVYGGLKP